VATVIAVLGAGPHGKQIAALQHTTKAELYDDNIHGYEPVLKGATRSPWLVGAAWPSVRRQIAEKCVEALTIESAYQRGNVLWPGAKVGNEVQLGKHVHIQWNAVVSHSCVVGDYVTICPGAVLSGEVHVEDDVFIGAGAVIIHGGVIIGKGALIGAGAVVLGDVPPGATVVGNPARVVR
jgi:acetyltransferase-like isoleucine patch superfamily enzyme